MKVPAAPTPAAPAHGGPEAPLGVLGPGWLGRGLSRSAVEARIAAGAVNAYESNVSQSWAQIVRRNTITRLNFLLLALGGATLVTGSAPDATFLGIALVNTVVGASQEVRAKRSLDALAVVSAPRARVVRDGAVFEILPRDVVVDDLLVLGPGDQLTADATVASGLGEVDESLATGESEPVVKVTGAELLSGSFVVAGSMRARVTAVGADSYANQLADEARRFSLASSELMRSITQLLRWLSWLMVLVAPVLVVRQLQSAPWRVAIRLAVGGLVGMIPEGLVLLTTLAFLAAAVRLARRRVLVQEIPAVETLARVDSLCVDKTGTLTESGVSLAGVTVAGGADGGAVQTALHQLASTADANATMRAIRDGVTSTDDWAPVANVPFSSARKWSGASFEGQGTWVVGAPEVVVASDPEGLLVRAAALAETGSRVLVAAHGSKALRGQALPDDLVVEAIVELRERARPQVAATLSYFAEEGVTVRVISGDSIATVHNLAERVGLPGARLSVDARSLPDDPDGLGEAVEAHRVFGRVTPQQKQAMVRALQYHGHTVAMTGDGVNDVLALKDADLGVAMGSGSAISRGVAQVVLLDNDFDVLPSVVAEGRRVLANIEGAAMLFLVKNVYSLILSVAISVTGWPYPFLPRHLTLISAVGIGIPGFFLALAPNTRRFRSGFLRRVLAFSLPAGGLTAAAVMLAYAGAREEGLSGDAARTAAIIVTVVVTLWVLVIVARPMTGWRAALVAAMAGLFVVAYFAPGVDSFFSLQHRPPWEVTWQALAMGAAAGALVDVLGRWRPAAHLDAPGADTAGA